MDRLLIRGTNWIGDAVMTLPALGALRRTYPKAHITVLAKPWVEDIYRRCPHVNEVLVFASPGRHNGIMGKIRLARELRPRRFAAAVLFQNAIEAAIIAALAGIPIRAGFDTDARGILLTHAVRVTGEIKKVHQTRYYLEMVKALGCGDGEEDDCYLPRDGRWDQEAARLLSGYGIGNRAFVGMAPGAAYGPAKRWSAERFAALADRMTADLGVQVLIFGSSADRETTEALTRHAHYHVIDLTGKTSLKDAMVLISRCRLFVTNDSGLMHVAAALKVPTVAIFGSTNPITTAPVGDKHIIVRKDIPCSPCLRKRCPSDFRCMTEIGVDDVYGAVRRLMG
ncbi:MAG: lipopolysaccharide heptosyltransferase II [Syntrophales bacterium]|nr:lipopolysaccharide heptosyltransferase II [Syntrophales bacterium]